MLIRALVIGIAYREKIKSRHDILQRCNAFNVIDSMKSYCGKYYFCEKCIDIFSFAWDHDPCPLKIC